MERERESVPLCIQRRYRTSSRRRAGFKSRKGCRHLRAGKGAGYGTIDLPEGSVARISGTVRNLRTDLRGRPSGGPPDRMERMQRRTTYGHLQRTSALCDSSSLVRLGVHHHHARSHRVLRGSRGQGWVVLQRGQPDLNGASWEKSLHAKGSSPLAFSRMPRMAPQLTQVAIPHYVAALQDNSVRPPVAGMPLPARSKGPGLHPSAAPQGCWRVLLGLETWGMVDPIAASDQLFELLIQLPCKAVAIPRDDLNAGLKRRASTLYGRGQRLQLLINLEDHTFVGARWTDASSAHEIAVDVPDPTFNFFGQLTGTNHRPLGLIVGGTSLIWSPKRRLDNLQNLGKGNPDVVERCFFESRLILRQVAEKGTSSLETLQDRVRCDVRSSNLRNFEFQAEHFLLSSFVESKATIPCSERKSCHAHDPRANCRNPVCGRPWGVKYLNTTWHQQTCQHHHTKKNSYCKPKHADEGRASYVPRLSHKHQKISDHLRPLPAFHVNGGILA